VFWKERGSLGRPVEIGLPRGFPILQDPSEGIPQPIIELPRVDGQNWKHCASDGDGRGGKLWLVKKAKASRGKVPRKIKGWWIAKAVKEIIKKKEGLERYRITRQVDVSTKRGMGRNLRRNRFGNRKNN